MTKNGNGRLVPVTDDPILTPVQVSEQTQIPIPTLTTWRCRGKGPVWFKLGGLVRYRQSEINRWLAESGDTTLTEVR